MQTPRTGGARPSICAHRLQRPTVEAEYRLPDNFESTCEDFNPPRTSYS